MHRTGSKPTRQVIWDELGANKGKKPNLVDVFRATRKKGTSLPNAETTQKYDEIRKIMEEEPTLSHVQVVQKVFKSMSHDRVVGFGGGITLKEISGPQPNREELQSKLNEASSSSSLPHCMQRGSRNKWGKGAGVGCTQPYPCNSREAVSN